MTNNELRDQSIISFFKDLNQDFARRDPEATKERLKSIVRVPPENLPPEAAVVQSILACGEYAQHFPDPDWIDQARLVMARCETVNSFDQFDLCDAVSKIATAAFDQVDIEHSEGLIAILTGIVHVADRLTDPYLFVVMSDCFLETSGRLHYAQYPELGEQISHSALRLVKSLRNARPPAEFEKIDPAGFQNHVDQLEAGFGLELALAQVRLGRNEVSNLIAHLRSITARLGNESIYRQLVVTSFSLADHTKNLEFYKQAKEDEALYRQNFWHMSTEVEKLIILSAVSKCAARFSAFEAAQDVALEASELFTSYIENAIDIQQINERLFRWSEFLDNAAYSCFLNNEEERSLGILLQKKHMYCGIIEALRSRSEYVVAAERWSEYAINAASMGIGPLGSILSMISGRKLKESLPRHMWPNYSYNANRLKLLPTIDRLGGLCVLGLDYAKDDDCMLIYRHSSGVARSLIPLDYFQEEGMNLRSIYASQKFFSNDYSRRDFGRIHIEDMTLPVSPLSTLKSLLTGRMRKRRDVPDTEFVRALEEALDRSKSMPIAETVGRVLDTSNVKEPLHLLVRDSLSDLPLDVVLMEAGVVRASSILLDYPNIYPSHQQYRMRVGHVSGGSLSMAEAERELVTSLLGKMGCEVLEINSKDALKREMEDLDLIWFTMHGGNPFGTPFDRHITIGQERLYVDEAVKLPHLKRSPLMVLGACDCAAFAQQRRAVDTRGLHYVFHSLGAKAVVACRWDMNTSAASLILASFIKGVESGLSSLTALHEAKIFAKSASSDELVSFVEELAPYLGQHRLEELTESFRSLGQTPFQHVYHWGCLGHYGTAWLPSGNINP